MLERGGGSLIVSVWVIYMGSYLVYPIIFVSDSQGVEMEDSRWEKTIDKEMELWSHLPI